ncbi:MAG: GNAT family N-acetyltransferase [Thermoplasmata archaeon]
MAGARAEVRAGIDAAWLVSALARDPVDHAFPAWDLANEPDRTRFVSLVSSEDPTRTLAYFAVWRGDPIRPVVHWFGDLPRAAPLLPHLPLRPLDLLGPPALAGPLRARRGPVEVEGIERMVYAGPSTVRGADDPRVRPAGAADGERLRSWARRHGDDPMVRGYAFFDPARHAVWIADDGRGEVVGASFAAVRLPPIWTLTAIWVAPEHRGTGLGRALTAAPAAAARRAGALAHLNVRSDNAVARRLYDSLGFRRHDRQVLVRTVGGGTGHNA